jgi:hypothetical protein
MIGDWSVRVVAGARTASFTLPMGAEARAGEGAGAGDPRFDVGVGNRRVILVLAALLGAAAVSRRLTAQRRLKAA